MAVVSPFPALLSTVTLKYFAFVLFSKYMVAAVSSEDAAMIKIPALFQV